MNADLTAALLGIIAAAIIVAFLLWRSYIRKNAAKQLKNEFMNKEDEHEL